MKAGQVAFASVLAICLFALVLQWNYTQRTVTAIGRYMFGETVNNTNVSMRYNRTHRRRTLHTTVGGNVTGTTKPTTHSIEVKGRTTSKSVTNKTKGVSTVSVNATTTETTTRKSVEHRLSNKTTPTTATKVLQDANQATEAEIAAGIRTDVVKFEYRDPNDPDLQQELKRRLELASEKKYIVDWYQYWPEHIPPRESCGNCEVTRNKSKITDNATAAVLFYFAWIKEKTMPTNRSLDQLYIYWNQEPPGVVRHGRNMDLKFEDRYEFNATMTYRRDSDFRDEIYYGGWRIMSILSRGKMTMNHVRRKTKLCIAVVSNCKATPGARLRMKMLAKIKEEAGSDMDALGRCFSESGERIKDFNKIGETISQYKFYFSFENSYHCKDYITEKVYRNAFYYRAVPVVLGASRADYEDHLPKNSFIYVEDFPSVEKLVEYLRYLDKNDTAYFEYFRWHNISQSEIPLKERIARACFLCRALHGINFDDLYNHGPETGLPRPIFDDGVTRRTVKSLSDWFYWEESPECMEKDETKLPIFKKYGLE